MEPQSFGKASGPNTHGKPQSIFVFGSTVPPPPPPPPPSQQRPFLPSKTEPFFGPSSSPATSPAEPMPQRQPPRRPPFPSKTDNLSGGRTFPNSSSPPPAKTLLQTSPPSTGFHQGTTQPSRGPYPLSSYPSYRPPAPQSASVSPALRFVSPNNQIMNGAPRPRSPFPLNPQPQFHSSPPPPESSPNLQSSYDRHSQVRQQWLPPERPQRLIASSQLENGNSQLLEGKISSPISRRPLSPSLSRNESTTDRSPVSLHDEAIRSNTPRLGNQRVSLADHANGLDQKTSHTAAAPDYVNERTSISPPNPVGFHAHIRNMSPLPIRLSKHLNETASTLPSKPAGIHANKRNRSPTPIQPSEYSETVTESEREMYAKAKRLARFGAELNQPVPNVKDSKWNSSEGKHNSSLSGKRNLQDHESGKTPEESFGNILEVEGQVESSTVITGLCQDMCPESERAERERKGDLDQYERLDGDRNQTNKSLAVKKYNRMAEREALLIRPMPVLQMTVDYLLQLLDRPYTDKFLGIYNFLWDRMRAIRMDLRMQHIFNQESMTMLEQMIRFHIIAMHELCEYKKGEGFSEGFDAHLNIEQMNKTSVELFQMYDDHRKKGIDVPTEKEFRGYYALLKLDKHPGYKVEPAELSLDLAKMTPEIRGTPEILFARAVARACRTGNFIAFFRLARKATYHQACLMHAHFSKLRTLALASLHSSLQNNQGIPVEQVDKWLAMEAEDVEALLEYHGFIIKDYQEAYMVKEGPFLNRDLDHPTKCSELVNSKKSARIVNDVSSGQTISDSTSWISASGVGDQHAYVATKTWQSDINKSVLQTERESVSHKKKDILRDAAELPGVPYIRDQTNYTAEVPVVKGQTADDEDMNDFDDDYPAGDDVRTLLTFSRPLTSDQISGIGYAFDEGHQNLRGDTSLPVDSLSGQSPHEAMQVISCDEDVPIDEVAVTERDDRPVQVGRMETSTSNYEVESSTHQEEVLDQKEVHDEQEGEALRLMIREKYEAARETLKMIIRIWRQRASMKRETREQQQHLASLAMNALSLGPPFHQNVMQTINCGDKLSMEVAIWKRDEKREKSWSRLNVAKLVRPILNKRNSMSCHCWKLMICVQRGATEDKCDELLSAWLLSKLMGAWNEADDELVVPTSNLSIWKDISNGGSHVPESCCFSVVRKVLLGDAVGSDITIGANAIVYLLSESLPFQIQRAHIQTLLESIPHQASLPLLILCREACKEVTTDLASKLGLGKIDETRISTISVVPLCEEYTERAGGFFSDENLKGGLQWLAEQCQIMPTLHLVKTRNIVLNFLGSSLQTLTNMRQSEVHPGSYVSIFNEALDQSARLVANTANMNVNCWPCPEIDLLESSFDRKVRDTQLASTGWSSSTKTDPILDAIERCKLPVPHYDLSWLGQGTHVKKEILDKKSNLEKCLYDYLTNSTEMMSGDLAAEEARIMVQKSATLELHKSDYYIVPRWAMIFQRIFNWRLGTLTSKECSFAYIVIDSAMPAEPLSCSGLNVAFVSKSEFGIRLENHEPDSRLLTSVLAEPSLDELIESGCCSLSDSQPASVMPPEIPSGSDEVSLNGYGQRSKEDQLYLLGESADAQDTDTGLSSKLIEVTQEILVHKPDKLTLLLKQCHGLQNTIDEKLSIYF